MPLTADLTALIRAKEVSQADLHQAALMTLDAVANMVAGTNSDPGRRIVVWARADGVLNENGIAGDPGRKALLLGSLCHILEVDDLHRASVVHPGCVVAPVLWSDIHGSGALEGKRALTALLHGFEATTRLGMAVGAQHYKVFHNTATCGPFGSAMATAYLLGLDEEACVHALGNAGTQAAGFWQFLATGAMSKHLHAGRGAEAGLVAASMAVHGITGAPEILEGEKGFFKGLCPDADPAVLARGPDGPWQAHLTSIKPWPSCRHTHPAIDSAQALRKALLEQGRGPDDIEAVEIEAYAASLALCDNADPQSLYAAKFSLQHCVAAALARDEVWFDAFDEAARADLASLRERCTVSTNPACEKAYPDAWGSVVTLKLKGGGELLEAREHARGDPGLPLTDDEMIAKAKLLLAHGGISDPMPFIEGILQMAEGGPLPALPGLLASAGVQVAAE